MNITHVTDLTTTDKEAVLKLWNKEYGEKIRKETLADLDNYFNGLADLHHFLLHNDAGDIAAWATTFTRNNERWFAIIVDSEIQGQGYGRQLLDVLKEHEPELNGWVVDHNNDIKANGQPYRSPLEFYIKNNFTLLPEQRLETEQISAVRIRWRR